VNQGVHAFYAFLDYGAGEGESEDELVQKAVKLFEEEDLSDFNSDADATSFTNLNLVEQDTWAPQPQTNAEFGTMFSLDSLRNQTSVVSLWSHGRPEPSQSLLEPHIVPLKSLTPDARLIIIKRSVWEFRSCYRPVNLT